MRILPCIPLDDGYEPSPVELNQEEGVLDISHPSECILMEETKIVAETLILRCELKPIALGKKDVRVQLISEGETLEDTLLYEEGSVNFGYECDISCSQWQGIALEYMDVGQGIHQGKSFHFKGTLLPNGKMEIGSPLYLKPFKIESQNYQQRCTTLSSGQVMTSPPGILDAQVLRGYGGYYQKGLALEEIQQVYYGVTSTHTKTRIRLMTSSKLHDQHTPPPHGGRNFNQAVVFSSNIRKEEFLSLSGAIVAGYAHIVISTDWGKIPFLSYFCEPVIGYPTFVNVYFKP